MRQSAHPPIVWLASILVGLNGLLSIWEGIALISLGLGFPFRGIFNLVIGALLLNRATGLWRMHRVAYIVTFVLMGLQTAFVALFILSSSGTIEAWASLVLLLIGLALLMLAYHRYELG